MLSYVLRRLLLAVLLVWAVASLAFVLTRLAPGDATLHDQWPATPAQQEEERRRLGLDQPLLTQYGRWLGDAVRLDFGRSSLYSRPVRELLGERMANTAILASSALVLATLLGLSAGIVTAVYPHRAATRGLRMLSILLLSTPPLIGSLVLVLIAAKTGWVPVGGMSEAGAQTGWERWADIVRHLPVPTLALALPMAATLERLQSDALSEARRLVFVGASRARGVTAAASILRHAWPVSLGSILGLYGLMIGTLFSGSFVVEAVTAWPGLGRLMVDALRARDLFLVSGAAAAGAGCLAVGTLVADVVHAALDPRVAERR